MARQFEGGKLVIASHNPGKVREIAELLEPFGAEVISAGDLGLTEPIEDGLTFIANAEIKARAAAEASGLPALADDSGLAVHALNGDPGIYSARWAGRRIVAASSSVTVVACTLAWTAKAAAGLLIAPQRQRSY